MKKLLNMRKMRHRVISTAAIMPAVGMCADFNEDEGLCVECAPRMNVEIAATRSRKMVEDINAKADETTVFNGEIESKTIVCPACGAGLQRRA